MLPAEVAEVFDIGSKHEAIDGCEGSATNIGLLHLRGVFVEDFFPTRICGT